MLTWRSGLDPLSKARVVRELETRLGSCLREVRRGQADRGEPVAGTHKRVAVKIVDDRGIESLKIIPKRHESRTHRDTSGEGR